MFCRNISVNSTLNFSGAVKCWFRRDGDTVLAIRSSASPICGDRRIWNTLALASTFTHKSHINSSGIECESELFSVSLQAQRANSTVFVRIWAQGERYLLIGDLCLSQWNVNLCASFVDWALCFLTESEPTVTFDKILSLLSSVGLETKSSIPLSRF
jgi:hypothetical protein